MHPLTLAHSPRDQRLKFYLLSALSISILLFTVIHLKHILPSHTPSLRPKCHTSKADLKWEILSCPYIYHNRIYNVEVPLKKSHEGPRRNSVDDAATWGFVKSEGKKDNVEVERVLPKKPYEGPRRNTVDDAATWGFVQSEGRKDKPHEGHHTVDEIAAWGFVKSDVKEKPRESPHKHSIADLDIWRLLNKYQKSLSPSHPHQSPHRYNIGDLNIWKLLAKPKVKEEMKEGEKTEMHGNGGEVCDSFFVSDLVGCAKVVNGKFRGGEGRKKLVDMGEDWAKIEEEVARIAKDREEKEESVMRKAGLR